MNPGATDVWYDGVDADCSGGSDYDFDGDGEDSLAYGGTDCDDTDASVNTGATEVWYDGVDADCAGNSDFDADGDGDYDVFGGTDCDDRDDSVYAVRRPWYDGWTRTAPETMTTTPTATSSKATRLAAPTATTPMRPSIPVAAGPVRRCGR